MTGLGPRSPSDGGAVDASCTFLGVRPWVLFVPHACGVQSLGGSQRYVDRESSGPAQPGPDSGRRATPERGREGGTGTGGKAASRQPPAAGKSTVDSRQSTVHEGGPRAFFSSASRQPPAAGKSTVDSRQSTVHEGGPRAFFSSASRQPPAASHPGAGAGGREAPGRPFASP
jgi:hypothetical protein